MKEASKFFFVFSCCIAKTKLHYSGSLEYTYTQSAVILLFCTSCFPYVHAQTNPPVLYLLSVHVLNFSANIRCKNVLVDLQQQQL